MPSGASNLFRWSLLLLSASAITCTTAAEKMNVLFIISDDLRTEMGCYGVTRAHTPHLDALASQGVMFERAYCQFPLCNPSRTSVLTGLRPLTTGVLGNRQWFGSRQPQPVSLPQYFRDHGYATLRAGKIFHGGIDDASAWTEGGEERFFGEGATADVPLRDRDDAIVDPKTGRPLTKSERSDRWLVLPRRGEDHGDYRVATRTIEYLNHHREGPFFIGCGFSKPHSPLEAPQRFYDLIDLDDITLPADFAPRPTVPEGFPAGAIRPKNADLFVGREATPQAAREMIRAYLASSAWMDWNAGRVLTALDDLGLRDSTIVVFWGDHGFQLGEKGKWSKAGSLWEQGTRVPLVIYDPRAKGNGDACPRVVESLDIYPTLVELCGLPFKPELEGKSLAPLLSDPNREWDRSAYTLWSEDGETVHGVSLRTEDYHFAEFFGRGAGKVLTQPSEDPNELQNLSANPNYTKIVEQLSRLAHEHIGSNAAGGR